ncbi:hypothetical protein EV361DRAFT_957199 [Lentinula raphanica]|nr:hypothetical protein EV361DRAFT_957199 [Lentinula raphanica]
MPSHTAASALIKLYFLGNYPWDWPIWQDRTGIHHGLFPDDDRLLPAKWTREDANDIKTYFQKFNMIVKDDDKIKFARGGKGAESLPGRKKWIDFVGKNWEKWKVHLSIVECLHRANVHPITLVLQEENLETWPSAECYVPLAVEGVAMELFGIEAFGQANILPMQTRKAVTILIQRSWSRIRKNLANDRTRLSKLEEAAVKAFAALNEGKPTKAKILSTMRAVAKWRDLVEIYGTEANTSKAQEMLGKIEEILESVGAGVRNPIKKGPRKSIKSR